jgi:hypothetical protein
MTDPVKRKKIARLPPEYMQLFAKLIDSGAGFGQIWCSAQQ